MKPITKIIGVIILLLAVTVYTVFNYISGKLDLNFFLIALALLAYALTSMVNQLILHLKGKR